MLISPKLLFLPAESDKTFNVQHAQLPLPEQTGQCLVQGSRLTVGPPWGKSPTILFFSILFVVILNMQNSSISSFFKKNFEPSIRRDSFAFLLVTGALLSSFCVCFVVYLCDLFFFGAEIQELNVITFFNSIKC